jgi:hypothetical protein
MEGFRKSIVSWARDLHYASPVPALGIALHYSKWLETRPPSWDSPIMVVKADDKKRVVLPGANPGDCFDVQVSGEEFRLIRLQKPDPAYPPSRNKREWAGRKGKRHMWDVLGEMGKAGLRIEESEEGQKPVPPCRF